MKKYELDSIFAELDIKKSNRLQVPDELCCKITFELMVFVYDLIYSNFKKELTHIFSNDLFIEYVQSDPVITNSGISYERDAITQHIQQNGEFDPVTRKKCTVNDLRSNISLREYIERYLEENPFAYPDENLFDVE